MPAKSKKQQIAMAIAEHKPDKLYKRDKAMKKMTKKELHDFAATKRSKLPKTAPKEAKKKQLNEIKKDERKEKIANGKRMKKNEKDERIGMMRRLAALKILNSRKKK